MDDIVRAALAKWPNVPDCYGWLAMDARGDFYMRDDRTSRAARGSRVEHDKLLAFIHRNYAADAQGRWFFQNGPQRVYLDLEVTPLVWRVDVGRESSITSNTGLTAKVTALFTDELGRLFAQGQTISSAAPLLGLIHTQDMLNAAEAIDSGAWPAPSEISSAQLEQLGGFVRQPSLAK
jgi:hypothetical protein